MKILICEDEAILAVILKEAGYQVMGITARSDECLLLCDTEPPDLVLVDLTQADGPTGHALATRLRRQGIEVITVSAEATLLPRPPPSRAVIDKPHRERDLLAAVARVKAG